MKALILAMWLAGSVFALTSGEVLVTASAPGGATAPTLGAHDVLARVDNKAATVVSMRPLRDAELWVVMDDGTSTLVGVQLRDIQNFIRQLPPSMAVGIGYARNGTVQKLQSPTTDREAAVKALRLPTGIPGISGSPYIALSDFLRHLPVGRQPREVVFISSGIDPYYGPGPQNPYLQDAIHNAQKAGVPVFSIYFSSAGRAGRSYRLINWGQNDLSELSDETGGEFYWQGDTNPVALEPFLKDVSRRMAKQYVMEVESPQGHSRFGRLDLRTEGLQVKLAAPHEVYLH